MFRNNVVGNLCKRAASNPNILEMYMSGHNPPILSIWAIIPEWDYSTEVNVGETMAGFITDNPKTHLDTMIISKEAKASTLPTDAKKIYEKS